MAKGRSLKCNTIGANSIFKYYSDKAFQVIFLRGGQSITAMAEEAGVSGSYFTRTLKYSFLAPDITKAIMAGRQPVQLTTRKLRLQTSMPRCWTAQKRLFEFI